MRTSVRNIMMGLMLAGGLLMATPMSAQMRNGRRPSGNDATMSNSRSSAARSNETRSAQSMTSGRTRSNMEAVTPRTQVATQKDNRSERRPNGGNNFGNGGNGGNLGNGGNGGNNRPNGGNNFGNGGNNRPNGGNNFGNGGNNRPNGGNNFGNGGNNRPNGGNNFGNGGNNRPNGGNNYGNSGNNRPNGGNNYGNGGNNRPNGGNHYGNDRRPGDNHGGYSHRPDNRGHNAYRDHYSWNYSHNNWSRPLPPPARIHRPAPYVYHRPRIPVGYRPYYGAPVIDRILGITFGTMFNVSLNYLYTNGYTIDGYDSRTVYLRNVHMLNFYWDDVMLCYDDYSRLMNAQFIYSASYNDRSRYNRLYHDLCATYGSPVEIDGRGVTWFGGNSVGYVTLETSIVNGRFYTNVFIGN